ncbi:gamma-glutamyltransferase [bacterium]|nr:gamma-glutamyltransferase [bacterium]
MAAWAEDHFGDAAPVKPVVLEFSMSSRRKPLFQKFAARQQLPLLFRRSLSGLLAVGALLLSLPTESRSADPSAATPADETVWQHAAVAADHPLASQAGVEVLRRGGNVVDAAVAVGFALSVLRPASSGLGGGGFMVIWDAKQQRAIALDYRERAPLAVSREAYAAAADESRKGGLAVGVPGHVRGLCHALEKYGSLPLAEVLKPALRYATQGVPLDDHEVALRKSQAKRAEPDADRFVGLWQQYLFEGNVPPVGTRVTSPQGRALQLIAEHGSDAFYRGEIAAAIVKLVCSRGSEMTLDDLAQMDVVERPVLTSQYSGFDVLTMPPPSSGGVALLETLNILDALEDGKLCIDLNRGRRDEHYYHVLAEVMKHAFADRAEFLGDADFVDVPVKRLTSDSYAEKLADRIQLDRTQPPEAYGRFLPKDDAGTTHFCVIDVAGNAVACTETINTSFGSWLVEPTCGIVLNNEMDDFTTAAGRPNAFGLIQSEANAIAPRKKPLSSMTPTILVKDGKAVFAAGASGGPRIISATLQVLLNMSRFGMTPQQAVRAPRIHHQWLPNTLLLESELMTEFGKPLQEKYGHAVSKSSGLAATQAASRMADGLRAASDPRKHGQAAGF